MDFFMSLIVERTLLVTKILLNSGSQSLFYLDSATTILFPSANALLFLLYLKHLTGYIVYSFVYI